MSVNEKMTALADEVRELSGTTNKKGIDEMANDIAAANDEIDEQVDLLAQVVAALDGKAAGSGGNSIVSVTIIDARSIDGAYYFDENSMIQHVALSTETVNALNGIVFTRSPIDTISPNGNYISSSQGAVSAVRFLEDGGTARIVST